VAGILKMEDISLFIDKLDVEESVKTRLKKIKPRNYFVLVIRDTWHNFCIK